MAGFITLPDGIRVYYERKKATKAVAVGVFVGVGSVFEDKDEGGLAHFVEHLNFKGTTKRSAFDIANEMDNKGININAFTTKSYTCFYTVGMAKYFETCVEMLSDIVFNSVYDSENIKREKGVVIEEINMYEDDGDDLCFEKLNAAYYGKGNLARPILGTIKQIEGYSRDDIVSFVNKWYTSQNTVISVVGNLSKEEVLSLVTEYFGKSTLSKPNDRLKLPHYKTYAKYIVTEKPYEQANVCIRFPAYNLMHKKEYAPYIVGYMLGGGMSSRLFQKVREELGLVYEISAAPTHYVGNGFFDISFATAPSKVVEATLAVKTVIDEVLRNGFTAEEHEKAKAQYETSFALNEESAADSMRIAGRTIIQLNKALTFSQCQKGLLKITAEDINNAVKYIFDFEKCSLSYVGKKPEQNILEIFLKGKCKK